jgi:Fic family protein
MCRIANVVEAGLAKRQTASEYLKELADIGVLDEVELVEKSYSFILN